MWNKKAKWAPLLLAIVLSLSACSSAGDKTPSNSSETPKDVSQGKPSDKPSNENVTITVLNEGAVSIGVGKMEELLPARKKLILEDAEQRPPVKESDFTRTPGESVHPGIFAYFYQQTIHDKLKSKNISVTTEDWGWGEPLIQKETAGFLAKNIPDIIVGETQMPGFAVQGLLEPFPDDMAAEIRETTAAAAWKPMEIDGKIYGFASQPGVNSLFWNKKLVREAGLDPEQTPKDWDELLANIQKVTEAGKGKFYGGGVYAGPNAGGYLRYGPLLVINKGGFADASGTPTFNSDANVKTVEFLRNLNKNHPAGLMVSQQEGPYFDAFKKQQTAYIIDGPWRAAESTSLGIEYGMAPIPLSAGGEVGNITIGAAFHAVPKDAKHKEAAFEYIRAMYSDEIQQLIADTGVRSPVKKSVAEAPEYKTKHPEMFNHYQAMNGNVQGLPTFQKDSSKVWQTFGDAVAKALMTNGNIKEILDGAQAKAEAIVK
ncbi:extracellular solute-binding protein [Paenibacillus sp. GCM10012307]|uniref:Extracellular solute-binding protein n=1 Tax=Paenibacillus roseus TaxID=2798579 RepID=A0A934J427_9BACL|nr:extracellular solute-binding protein [Paenibacillus roseus]MBJ6362460.1 extracellular solute-binding protein [Paenibacillus roseus]